MGRTLLHVANVLAQGREKLFDTFDRVPVLSRASLA